MNDIIYQDESYEIMGAAFEVYKDKGNGFLESVYQECLALEFDHVDIPYQAEREFELTYRNQTLDKTFRVDFVCYQKIILELKAVDELIDRHRAQLHNYLRATNFKLGILMNFGDSPELEYERIVL